MKLYLETDGGLVIGQSVITRNSSVEFLYSADNLRVRIAPINGSHLFYGAITDLTDSEGASYANRAALETATKDFFFRVGGSGVSADGFLYFPTTISNKGLRIGERSGWYWAVDRALTTTAFDGNEGEDWENIAGNEIPV